MKFEITNDRAYFSDASVATWLGGFLFIGVGLMLMWGALGGFSNYYEIEPWQLWLSRGFALAAIGAGIFCIYQAPLCSMTIQGVIRTVELRRRGPFTSETAVYPLADIRGFAAAELRDGEDDLYYELAMDLANGERILISRSYYRLKDHFEHKTAELNSFLNRHRADNQ